MKLNYLISVSRVFLAWTFLIFCPTICDLVYYLGLNSSEEEIKELLQEVDSDGDGGIDFPTFLAVLDSKLNKPKETDQDILEIFRIFDPKGSDVFGEQKSGSGWVQGLLFGFGSGLGINISGMSPCLRFSEFWVF